jgi:hypothetical protein
MRLYDSPASEIHEKHRSRATFNEAILRWDQFSSYNDSLSMMAHEVAKVYSVATNVDRWYDEWLNECDACIQVLTWDNF